MTMQKQPDPAEIEDLEQAAEALEDRAEHDGLIPDANTDDDGVGPRTGIVP